MPVFLTPSAAGRVHSFLAKRGGGVGLRLAVKKTGCSGYAYVVNYADEVGTSDVVFEDRGVKVIVDAESDSYCPSQESLRSTLASLAAMKVPPDTLRVESRKIDCWRRDPRPVASTSTVLPRPSFGTVMLSVARRFEGAAPARRPPARCGRTGT